LSVALMEEFFLKKWEMAPTVLNHPRRPSAQDLALGEGRFLVRSVPGRSSSSVALGEAGVSRSVREAVGFQQLFASYFILHTS
jgi:hypothetical protein